MLKFYKYSGAGNTFVVIDGRTIDASRFKRKEVVHALCMEHGTDGLMVLENSDKADFRMSFFNPDGSGGMMCGNGGRCIVAFADVVGVKPFHTKEYAFEAADGIHHAEILSHLGECKQVRLEMHDVDAVEEVAGGFFLNTGAPHFVLFVEDVEKVDVETEGRRLRSDGMFGPEGTNVDFVSVDADSVLHVRTFERGVEGETSACGTGITASAIAACTKGIASTRVGDVHTYEVQARQDRLSVDFRQDGRAFVDVHLTGPTLNLGDLIE